MKKKILYLYSDTGGGHRAAANSLISAVKRIKGDEVEQEAIDVFASGSSFLNIFARGYAPMIKYVPWFWRILWFSINNHAGLNILEFVATPFIQKKLIRIISEKKPDVLVSVHPLVNHLTINAVKKMGKKIPFVTVGMDPVDLHISWVCKDTDAMVVATEEAKAICIREGLTPEKIHVLGIPIDPRFDEPGNKEAVRATFGLKKDLLTVLVMGGGEGAGNILDIAMALNKSDLNMQLIVICGRNESLKNKLESFNFRFPKKVIGFTNDVPLVMDATDIIITKGGPGAIFEALAKELPMIITSWLPGQEEGNVRFVENQNIGYIGKDPKKISELIKRIMSDKKVKDNIRKLKKPRSVFDIVNLIITFLPK
jgi:1,2-diacylglycerol 3-beta-galactosyltransferase